MIDTNEPARRGPGGMNALEAAAAVHAGRTTAAELLSDAWDRARSWEPQLGALVERIDREADADGPLAGVVTGVKDAFAVEGVVRTLGAPNAVDPTPQHTDAHAVTNLTRSGATLMATTQVHPLCFGVITPATSNPRNYGRIAGGSSGGSAAALAAGLVHVALGTDSGGSVRGPSACCGVVGLKTTRGLIGLTGAFELTWSLDTIGPMATTVADVELALNSLLLPDPYDPVHVAQPPLAPALRAPYRIGVPRSLEAVDMDADVTDVWRATLDDLSDAGHAVVEVDLPGLLDAPRANGLILGAEAAAIHHTLLEITPSDVPDHVLERLRWGAERRATEVATARRHATVLAAEFRAVCRNVDVLSTPTLPARVPKVGHDRIPVGGIDRPTTYAMTTLTNPWNLLGVPAGSVPAGMDADGGPVGVQIIGQWWGERAVLAVMEAIETLRGGPWPTAEAPTGPTSTP